jgi:hypothetical protein
MDAVIMGDHNPAVQEADGKLTLDFGEKLKIHYKCKASGADVILIISSVEPLQVCDARKLYWHCRSGNRV